MTAEITGEILVYERGGAPAVEVRLDADTVWLSQQQIADLFETSRENVTMHLRNVYDGGELGREATSKDLLRVRREGDRTARRSVTHYNLNAVISLGYRVDSTVATQFRVWATTRLREYLVAGYTLSQTRLDQLGSIVQAPAPSSDELVAGVADVLADYVPGSIPLRDYDEGRIEAEPSAVPGWVLTIGEARETIGRVAAALPTDVLLGKQRGDALAGVIGAVHQGFGGQDLHPTVEEKATHLLYSVVKDHTLSDGNKRSAAALFLTFFAWNSLLHDRTGRPRVTNNALAATTLMVAMSDPEEKDLMIALLVRLLADDAA